MHSANRNVLFLHNTHLFHRCNHGEIPFVKRHFRICGVLERLLLVATLALVIHTPAHAQFRVLLYHAHPNLGYVEANFIQHMDFLVANDYRTITPDQFIAWKLNNEPLPMRPTLITVDDNYILMYTSMYPILRDRGLVAVNFVITGSVGNTVGLHYCSWEELRTMEASGNVINESHTVSHPHLTTLNATNQTNQVVNSRTALAANIPGKVSKYIAYPYGDYNAGVITRCIAAGYTAGFAVGNGVNYHDTPMFELQRKGVDTVTFSGFREELGHNAWQPAPGPGWVMDDADVHFYADSALWPVVAGSNLAGGSGRVRPAGTGSPAAWAALVPRPGIYRVHAKWSAVPARTSTALYTVHHAGGQTTFAADQRANDGAWNLLGEVQFNTTAAARVELAASPSGSVSADAVWLEFVSSTVDDWAIY